MTEIHPHTGPKILFYRELRGLTLRELAKRSGVNHGLIGNYERRDTAPQYGNCLKLAKALGVSVSVLWDLTPPPTPKSDLPFPLV